MGVVSKITIIIPCYNEAERLDVQAFLAWVREVEVDLLFVDDGSTDNTLDILEEMSDESQGAAQHIFLAENQGKAEAVRQGMLHAFSAGADLVGYLDADLATSLVEAERIIEALMASDKKVAMGSRVALIDRDIERTATRHYLGRAFATFASAGLGARFYDTQCGAKFFKASPRIMAALENPFITKWVFDVELLWRLMYAPFEEAPYSAMEFMEVPLKAWEDKQGSKIGMGQTANIFADCMRLMTLFAKK